MPYEVGTHTDSHPVVFDSGDFELLLDKGLPCFGYEEMLRWRADDPGPGRRRGVGVSYFVEKSGIAHWEYARVAVGDDGGAVATWAPPRSVRAWRPCSPRCAPRASASPTTR